MKKILADATVALIAALFGCLMALLYGVGFLMSLIEDDPLSPPPKE